MSAHTTFEFIIQKDGVFLDFKNGIQILIPYKQWFNITFVIIGLIKDGKLKLENDVMM